MSSSSALESVRARVALILFRLSGWPRRAAALVLLGLAALLALQDHPAGSSAASRPRSTVLVAAHELAAGSLLAADDVRTRRFDAAQVPDGAVGSGDPPVGRTVAIPIRAGEILTDVRFIGRSLTRALGSAGAVAVPVRLADADAARLLRPGDHVDVFGSVSGEGQGAARVLAEDAVVILVPAQDEDVGLEGALVLLATDSGTARRLATDTAESRITATLRAN